MRDEVSAADVAAYVSQLDDPSPPEAVGEAQLGEQARRSNERETAIETGRLPVWRGLELDFDDEVRADVIQRLMCLGKVDMADVERRYGIDFASYFSEALERLHPLVADGLATVVGDYICATPRGRLLLRVIAMCFDRHLQSPDATEARQRFSKVV
jgi:oxygen-independent coproporphyrinogen-3 oxidase